MVNFCLTVLNCFAFDFTFTQFIRHSDTPVCGFATFKGKTTAIKLLIKLAMNILHYKEELLFFLRFALIELHFEHEWFVYSQARTITFETSLSLGHSKTNGFF